MTLPTSPPTARMPPHQWNGGHQPPANGWQTFPPAPPPAPAFFNPPQGHPPPSYWNQPPAVPFKSPYASNPVPLPPNADLNMHWYTKTPPTTNFHFEAGQGKVELPKSPSKAVPINPPPEQTEGLGLTMGPSASASALSTDTGPTGTMEHATTRSDLLAPSIISQSAGESSSSAVRTTGTPIPAPSVDDPLDDIPGYEPLKPRPLGQSESQPEPVSSASTEEEDESMPWYLKPVVNGLGVSLAPLTTSAPLMSRQLAARGPLQVLKSGPVTAWLDVKDQLETYIQQLVADNEHYSTANAQLAEDAQSWKLACLLAQQQRDVLQRQQLASRNPDPISQRLTVASAPLIATDGLPRPMSPTRKTNPSFFDTAVLNEPNIGRPMLQLTPAEAEEHERMRSEFERLERENESKEAEIREVRRDLAEANENLQMLEEGVSSDTTYAAIVLQADVTMFAHSAIQSGRSGGVETAIDISASIYELCEKVLPGGDCPDCFCLMVFVDKVRAPHQSGGDELSNKAAISAQLVERGVISSPAVFYAFCDGIAETHGLFATIDVNGEEDTVAKVREHFKFHINIDACTLLYFATPQILDHVTLFQLYREENKLGKVYTADAPELKDQDTMFPIQPSQLHHVNLWFPEQGAPPVTAAAEPVAVSGKLEFGRHKPSTRRDPVETEDSIAQTSASPASLAAELPQPEPIKQEPAPQNKLDAKHSKGKDENEDTPGDFKRKAYVPPNKRKKQEAMESSSWRDPAKVKGKVSVQPPTKPTKALLSEKVAKAMAKAPVARPAYQTPAEADPWIMAPSNAAMSLPTQQAEIPYQPPPATAQATTNGLEILAPKFAQAPTHPAVQWSRPELRHQPPPSQPALAPIRPPKATPNQQVAWSSPNQAPQVAYYPRQTSEQQTGHHSSANSSDRGPVQSNEAQCYQQHYVLQQQPSYSQPSSASASQSLAPPQAHASAQSQTWMHPNRAPLQAVQYQQQQQQQHAPPLFYAPRSLQCSFAEQQQQQQQPTWPEQYGTQRRVQQQWQDVQQQGGPLQQRQPEPLFHAGQHQSDAPQTEQQHTVQAREQLPQQQPQQTNVHPADSQQQHAPPALSHSPLHTATMQPYAPQQHVPPPQPQQPQQQPQQHGQQGQQARQTQQQQQQYPPPQPPLQQQQYHPPQPQQQQQQSAPQQNPTQQLYPPQQQYQGQTFGAASAPQVAPMQQLPSAVPPNVQQQSITSQQQPYYPAQPPIFAPPGFRHVQTGSHSQQPQQIIDPPPQWAQPPLSNSTYQASYEQSAPPSQAMPQQTQVARQQQMPPHQQQQQSLPQQPQQQPQPVYQQPHQQQPQQPQQQQQTSAQPALAMPPVHPSRLHMVSTATHTLQANSPLPVSQNPAAPRANGQTHFAYGSFIDGHRQTPMQIVTLPPMAQPAPPLQAVVVEIDDDDDDKPFVVAFRPGESVCGSEHASPDLPARKVAGPLKPLRRPSPPLVRPPLGPLQPEPPRVDLNDFKSTVGNRELVIRSQAGETRRYETLSPKTYSDSAAGSNGIDYWRDLIGSKANHHDQHVNFNVVRHADDQEAYDYVRKLKPRPCHKYYLYGECSTPSCQYGHKYELSELAYSALAKLAKEMVCPDLDHGRCGRLESECLYGHRCPKGSRCKWGSNCWFANVPDGHAKSSKKPQHERK